MHDARIRVASLATCLALSFSACQNLSPGENAAFFGVLAGAATAIPLAVAGVDPAVTIPVSIGAAALAAGGAYVISKNQATERQRKIAEQRARLYLAKQEQEEGGPTRYIAVATGPSTKGQTPVMIYDRRTGELVGNSVYLVKTPKIGSVAKYDTYSAEYVGGGG